MEQFHRASNAKEQIEIPMKDFRYPRPYRTKSTWKKNSQIRKEVKRKKLKWTNNNGIDKYLNYE